MTRIRYVFRTWLRRNPAIKDYLYNRDNKAHEKRLRVARANGTHDIAKGLIRGHEFEERWEKEDDEIAFTKRLVRQADRLRVPLPKSPNYNPAGDSNEFWKFSDIFGTHYLTRLGVSALRESIRIEKSARGSERNHWLTVLGVLGGIIGTITGLIAVLRK